ncbi:PiggyBac transposable element-derived protein 4 [Plakobranchus ocellatus]|uniref:PiggyBac transposable element-derived protein 4 n=1 Tax=Plakobranchus ocellatus TaxID=259542 RepID=A0AAV3YIN4_9GAST|nr:PiggyBac transposable element-derived protein 4 [Plakobranchus ocellatus]
MLSSVLNSHHSKKGKNVLLLSTMHSVSERCEARGKPEIVLTYNKSKGGVNTMDQMAYAFTERTKRWLLVALFNITDLSTNDTRVIRQASCLMIITSSFHHCVYKRTGTPAGVKESIWPNHQPPHQTEHRPFSEVSPLHTSPDSLFTNKHTHTHTHTLRTKGRSPNRCC